MAYINSEDYCRFCSELFCCHKCRFRHEQSKHNLKFDCNICIYGKMFFNNKISDQLFDHIEKEHLPVQCHLCKLSFNDLCYLKENHKCFSNSCTNIIVSVDICENMESTFSENNNYSISMHVPTTLATSTPVGAEINRVDIEVPSINISSPDENNSVPEEAKNEFARNTPVEYALKSKNDSQASFPLVTPLRSIIAKSKSQNVYGENTRRVKFFDSESTPDDCRVDSLPNNSKTPSKKKIFSPPMLSPTPATPSNSLSDIFYTPENRALSREECGDEPSANVTGKAESSSSAFVNLWSAVTNSLKNVYMHVSSLTSSNDASESSLCHDTSKSIKRHLSPDAEKRTPSLKRICIRGCKSKSKNRSNISPF